MFRRFWPPLLIRILLIGISATVLAYFWMRGSFPINLIIWTGITLALILNTGYFIFKILDGIEQHLIGLKNSDFSNLPLKYYRWGKLARLRKILEDIQDVYQNSSRDEKLENELFQTAVSLAPVGILMWDSEGKIIIFNDTLKDQINLDGVLSTDRLRKIRPVLFNKLDKLEIGYAGLIEYESGRKENKFSARKSIIKVGDSMLTMLVLQQVNTEMESAESAAWEKLMKIMTHEIMNSITSVHSLSSTLKTLIEQKDSENALKAIESIERRSSGLLQFVQDYRTLSEIPSPQLEEVRLSEFLENFIEEIKPINPQITFELDISRKITARCDIEQLRLVLTNLYLNSNFAMKEVKNPTLEIVVRQKTNGNIEIKFSDNGPGMNKSTLDNSFIPFFTTRKDGSGIGLPLSRQLMRAMGGRLVLTSEENEGTTAKITLKTVRPTKND